MNPMQKLAVVAMALLLVRAICWVIGAGLLWLMKLSRRGARRAPAVFVGVQECPGLASFEIYNLTADIPGHPVNSTVSRATLEAAGYEVPVRRDELSPKK